MATHPPTHPRDTVNPRSHHEHGEFQRRHVESLRRHPQRRAAEVSDAEDWGARALNGREPGIDPEILHERGQGKLER